MCVPVWLRRIASRRATSMLAVAGLTRAEDALGDARHVAAQVGQGEGRVDHLGAAGIGADRARVADLTAAYRIERRAVEKDLDGAVVGVEHGEHAGIALGVRVPGEIGDAELLDDLAVVVDSGRRRCRCGGPPSPAGAATTSRARSPPRSTSVPRSAAISWVSSRGKPNVSWSVNAAVAGQTVGARANSSSSIGNPLRSVWRNRSSSLLITPVMKSRCLATSG